MNMHISVVETALRSVLAKNPEIHGIFSQTEVHVQKIFLWVWHNPARHAQRQPIMDSRGCRVMQLTVREVELCTKVMQEILKSVGHCNALLLGVVEGLFEYEVFCEV
ncbi:MAG TPA: hypothetical protein VLG69_01130 [Candidatus Andersenbacteria bacterium]|nr:hypothetical protein [Candidatus Andersenbacteria bacterium]